MSHLRPDNIETGLPKTLDQYTDAERVSAFEQVLDVEVRRFQQSNGKPAPKATVDALLRFSKGRDGKDLPCAAKIPEHVLEAATATPPKK